MSVFNQDTGEKINVWVDGEGWTEVVRQGNTVSLNITCLEV
jgi:hypothetical protein